MQPPSATDLWGDLGERIIAIQRQLLATEERSRQEARSHGRAHDDFSLAVIDVLDLTERLCSEEGGGLMAKVARRLKTALTRQGIEEIVPSLASPSLVKVVDTRAIAGEGAAKILEICRKGYRLGDRVLRPAEVITNRP